jgi:drug/metabolite transporter (DMT)-like permease
MAAASWGGSDFVGGLGARRASALLIVASGQILSFALFAALCLGWRLALPGPFAIAYALAAGFVGSLALALFYRALAIGAMGLTAALTGLLTALVPVVYSLLRNGLPGPLVLTGLATGLAAIWLITHASAAGGLRREAARGPASSLVLAILAGTGFGAQLILIKMAGEGSLLWTMTFVRAAGVAALLLVILLRPPRRPWTGFWQPGFPAGLLDSIGIVFYIEATRFGRLDAAAVVCSLYPAGTILLAALLLHERPSPRQVAGMALALGAVMLLSL